MVKCCLCKKELEGRGYNAQPIKSGKCCYNCNVMKVIPARMKVLGEYKER